MIASFADPGQRTTSAPFGHALNRLAEERPEIVGLSADLAKYTDMHVFRDAHPDRFFQMGMAEQAMLGAAAGMAEVGLVPFASTYSVFATRRAYDFLCLDIAEPGLNVNVVGALPGLTTGYGPSHQATEDLAILRGTGARGLRAIMEEVLNPVMYDIPGRDDVAKVVVTEQTVKENVNPTIVPRQPSRRERRDKSA